MAKLEGGFLRGSLGNLSYRVMNGVQIVSALPAAGSVKQSPATRQAAETFGMASALGAQFRKAVRTQISHFSDGSLNSRLASVLVKVLNECRDADTKVYDFHADSFSKLNNLEYNRDSPVEKLMKIRPQMALEDGLLTVSIPELNIPRQLRFPDETFHCKISVVISLFRLGEGKAARVPLRQEISITKDKSFLPAQDLVFDVPDGCLCVVSLFLEYAVSGILGWEPVNRKKFNPGYICGVVITAGEYPDTQARGWLTILKF